MINAKNSILLLVMVSINAYLIAGNTSSQPIEELSMQENELEVFSQNNVDPVKNPYLTEL